MRRWRGPAGSEWCWRSPWGAAWSFWCSCWPVGRLLAVGQATWVWYEHVARRELPFPSLADVGHLLAIPLAAAAMLAFPGRAERAALQMRSLLDGAVFAAGPSWPWSC